MEELRDAPFALVGVNSDEDIKAVMPELKKRGIDWPSFWNGPEGTRGPISMGWGVRGWPSFFVIDRGGIIRLTTHIFEDARELVRELLKRS